MLENTSLLPYNTFHIAARARYFAAVQGMDQVEEWVAWNRVKQLPLLVLGGGSNVLLTQDFGGLVLKNELMGIEVVGEDDETVYVRAGAGENWHRFVVYCVDNGFAGVENLSLIPGSVGACPIQNIGAYGVEIKDVFFRLEAYHIADRKVVVFGKEQCGFGYRDSVFKTRFKNQFIILHVTFRLLKKPRFNIRYGALQQELEKEGGQLSLKAVSEAVISIRQSKLPDPAVTGNAGSFFKNPEVPSAQYENLLQSHPHLPGYSAGEGGMKLAAGWLIEQCGWKGYRKGDAGCYPKQALVLVNYGSATGQQIWDLSQQILESVQQKFGILLEREVNIL